jgi:hypothetical protein
MLSNRLYYRLMIGSRVDARYTFRGRVSDRLLLGGTSELLKLLVIRRFGRG